MQYIVFQQIWPHKTEDNQRTFVGESQDVNEVLALIEMVPQEIETGDVEARVVVRQKRGLSVSEMEYTEQLYDGATMEEAWRSEYKRRHPRLKHRQPPPRPHDWVLHPWHGLIQCAADHADDGQTQYDPEAVDRYRHKLGLQPRPKTLDYFRPAPLRTPKPKNRRPRSVRGLQKAMNAT